ncbi:MarR family transcriptional regulator [Kribbella sp. NPDC048915]|uniref:MarR family winged helix-turn-helix transcriptional regulator n=1 Tax=Kribbella sp. NPDC048915 TaxID=3155148 RepID=UPI0033D0CF40
MKDFVDAHVDLWAGQHDLDREVEGIAVRLQVLTRHLERRREAVLATYDLQLWEFKTLHMLRRAGTPYRATPGELAKQLGMSAAALTNRIDALERRGFVERTHDRDDRRKVMATLTPTGNQLWQRAIGEIVKVEKELIHHLPAADRTRLDDLLRRLVLVTEKNDRPAGKVG